MPTWEDKIFTLHDDLTHRIRHCCGKLDWTPVSGSCGTCSDCAEAPRASVMPSHLPTVDPASTDAASSVHHRGRRGGAMTTYRSPYIRGAVLRNLGEVAGEPRMRYAQVIGIITALLDDDRKMVEAIRAACYEKRKEYSA